LNYHNLSIRGTGEKTLNNAAFATNLVDVGDGTNAVTFTIPQAYPLTGTVTVLNNGTLNIQNLVNPTLGTLNSGSTVIYSALANQSVVGANYHNLNIRGTGNKTLAGNATAGGLVSVGDGTNAVTLTVPTAYTLAGTVNVATNATLDIHNVTLPTLVLWLQALLYAIPTLATKTLPAPRITIWMLITALPRLCKTTSL
jgi:hypothetical protein